MPLYYVSKLARDSGVIVCQVAKAPTTVLRLPIGTPLRLQRYSSMLPIPSALRNVGLASSLS